MPAGGKKTSRVKKALKMFARDAFKTEDNFRGKTPKKSKRGGDPESDGDSSDDGDDGGDRNEEERDDEDCPHEGKPREHCERFGCKNPYIGEDFFIDRGQIHVDHRLVLGNDGDVTKAARDEICSRYPSRISKEEFDVADVELDHTHLRFATDVLTLLLLTFLKPGQAIFEIAAKFNKTLNMLIKSHSLLKWDYFPNRPEIFQYDRDYIAKYNIGNKLLNPLDMDPITENTIIT